MSLAAMSTAPLGGWTVCASLLEMLPQPFEAILTNGGNGVEDRAFN